MPFRTIRLALGSLLAASSLTLLPFAAHASAAAQPVGTVIVSGADWAGADASLGDLNVYSNGSTFTGPYQCTELAIRWAAARFSESRYWPIRSAAEMWRAGPNMPVPFTQLPNGGGVLPQYGDILVFDVTPTFSSGHVAIVTSVAGGFVNFVEQNGSWTGRDKMPIVGSTMPPRAGSQQPVIGWLRALNAPYTPSSSGPGGQILDGYGSLYAFGSASPVASSVWSGWDIARGVVTQPGNPNAGYTLDGWGGIHPFGGAPAVQVSGYWLGWDITRTLVLRADGVSGYVLDDWGGLHPFGTPGHMAPSVTVSAYWPGWSIARAVVLRADGVSGYVLDGWGGLHPFGVDLATVPAISGAPYWAGWDIARGVALGANGGGYVLDGFGGLHEFGGARSAAAAYFFGADVARGIKLTSATGGYVVYRTGVVVPFGDAPAVSLQLMSRPLGRGVG